MLTVPTRRRNDRFLRCGAMYADQCPTIEVDDAVGPA